YTVSRLEGFHDSDNTPSFWFTNGANFLVPDIGFHVNVNQFGYRSVLALKSEVTFFLANSFISGNRIRAFRIVGANSTQNRLTVSRYSYMLGADWTNTSCCQPHSGESIRITASVINNGNIQYKIFV
ncbi:hypothetical protein EWB00_005105, partial [Schistosoma japonicum]